MTQNHKKRDEEIRNKMFKSVKKKLKKEDKILWKSTQKKHNKQKNTRRFIFLSKMN